MITESEKKPIERMMTEAYFGMRNMIGADMVVGNPISAGEGTSILPICKVTLGFLTGGGEFSGSKSIDEFPFAGGSGTGMSVVPVGFLVCENGKVKVVNWEEKSVAETLTQMLPDLVKSLSVVRGSENGKKKK